jgi:MFS family permease
VNHRAKPHDQGLSREVKVVAGVVVLGVITSLLDTTIVSVALDTLSRDLHSSLSTIQWVSTGATLIALIPASILAMSQRRERRASAGRELRAAEA